MEKRKVRDCKEGFYPNEQTVPVSFKETLRNLADSSSLHGIPKIVSSRQAAVKVLWCLLFLGTFTVLAIQLYNLFKTYYSYPIKTTVSLQYSPIAFPAVTFCNMNPVRKSRLGMSEMVKTILAAEDNNSKKKLGSRRRRNVPDIKEVSKMVYNGNEEQTGSLAEYPSKEKQEISKVEMNQSYARVYDDTRTGRDDINDGNIASVPQVVLQSSPLTQGKYRHRRQTEGKPPGMDGTTASSSDTITKTSSETDGGKADSSDTVTKTSSETDGKTAGSSDALSGTSSETGGTKTGPGDGKTEDKEETGGTKTGTGDGKTEDKEETGGTKTGTGDGKTEDKEDASSGTWTASLDELKELYDKYHKTEKEAGSAANPLSKDQNYSWTTESGASGKWNNAHNPTSYVLSQMFSKKDEWDERVDGFRTVFKEENMTYRRQMGHQKEDMILSSSFAGILESLTAFQDFSSSEYGNCFTMSSPDYVAWRSGPSHGIKLTLNLEIDEYVPNFSTGYGIRVLLHEKGTYPLPSNEGITLSPGTETNIGLRMEIVSEQYGAWCEGSSGSILIANAVWSDSKQYGSWCDCVAAQSHLDPCWSQKHKVCYQFCRIMKTMDDCKCVPVDSPDEINLSASKLPVCNITDDSVKACLLGVDVNFNNGHYDCDCNGPCKETVYEMTMSSRFWPTDDYLDVLMDEMCTENYTLMSTVCENKDNLTFDQKEKYRKNFLRVLIYYEDLNYESITQEPMYEGVRFLSDIGGAMGLFLGASVLSLVEFLQLLLEIFLFVTKKAVRDKNRVKSLK